MMFTKYMRGMVYWCDIPKYDKNPHVQSSMRPVIIVSNNVANCLSNNITVVPCTTNIDKNPNQPTHCILPLNKETPSLVLCEDVITVHKELLAGFMGMLDDKTMETINNCLMAALGLCEIPNPFDNPLPEISYVEPIEEKPKRAMGKKIFTNEDVQDFLDYVDQFGIELTMLEYGIPTESAVKQRINAYKKRLNKE